MHLIPGSGKTFHDLYYLRKITEDGENVFFKAVAKKFLLTSKSCLWLTFYQLDVMKR